MNGFILRQCHFTYIKVKKKSLNWNLNIWPLANDASALITELLRSIILIDSHINASTVPLSTECIKKRFCKKGLKNTILFFHLYWFNASYKKKVNSKFWLWICFESAVIHRYCEANNAWKILLFPYFTRVLNYAIRLFSTKWREHKIASAIFLL